MEYTTHAFTTRVSELWSQATSDSLRQLTSDEINLIGGGVEEVDGYPLPPR